MKISDLGEFGLISRIRKLSRGKTSSTLIGIGDDAAVLALSASHVMLVTTDILLEDVHFDLSYTDYYSLGWKAAAVNLSDIAAMGGSPRFCLTALGIPRRTSAEQVFEFYRGFNSLLHSQTASLVGGDTCSSGHGLFISVTAIGEAKPDVVITRAGARPGDRIFVTGTLGDSAAGLEILQMRNAPDRDIRGRAACGTRIEKSEIRNPKSEIERLIEKHLRPVPRVSEGRKLARSGCASAMIDISDGLSSDLLHISEQSRVGAELFADRIPLSSALQRMSTILSKMPVRYALEGGEDYELLFTVPEAKLKKLHSLKLPVTEIGAVTTGRTVKLVDAGGKKNLLQAKGYDHFRNSVVKKKKC